jgi:hypothetical protein
METKLGKNHNTFSTNIYTIKNLSKLNQSNIGIIVMELVNLLFSIQSTVGLWYSYQIKWVRHRGFDKN